MKLGDHELDVLARRCRLAKAVVLVHPNKLLALIDEVREHRFGLRQAAPKPRRRFAVLRGGGRGQP